MTKATFESQAEDAAEAVSGTAPVTHMADDAGHPMGLTAPRLYWSVLAIWLAMGMSVIDQSIANIALPTIAREVGATPAGSIWVLNANQIAVAMTLLPVAALGDIFGCRRIYLIGLCIFIAASIGCTRLLISHRSCAKALRISDRTASWPSIVICALASAFFSRFVTSVANRF